MRILLIFIFLTSVIWADIVKNKVNVSDILQQIDSISKSIQLKEQIAQKNAMMSDPNFKEHDSAKDEFIKKEAELQKKQKKLDYLKRVQAYQQNVQLLNKESMSYIKRKAKKLISKFKMKLDTLKKVEDYKLPVKQYMQIGTNKYAYLDSSELEKVKISISQNEQKINSLEENIEILKSSYNTDKDTLMMQISRFDNTMQDNIESLSAMSKNIPTGIESSTKNNSLVKVKIGDKIGDIIISAIDEYSVTVISKKK